MVALITAFVIIGGIKRIGAVTEKLVPFMAVIYIIAALIVVFANIGQIGVVLGANVGTAITAQIIRLMDVEAGAGSILYFFKSDNLAPVALVIGTTGYSKEEIEKINKAAQQIPVFFTFNMSLGINLLTDLAKRAASILGEQFDIEIVEQHHNQKIDAPSGTAIMLANAINEELDNKYTYVYDRHSVRAKRTKTEIGIHAVRGGTIVGTHEIIFAGRDEVITLKHEAHSKQVFAVGSVNPACFLAGKPAGLYSMNELIKEM